MKQNVKIAKELVKLAKSLIAVNVEVDPSEHTLQELKEWIKYQFERKAYENLHKLSCKDAIGNLKQVTRQPSNRVHISGDPDAYIIFNKIFSMPYDGKMPQNVEIEEKGLSTYVKLDHYAKDKTLLFEFYFVLKGKDWYPLFRSCKKELTYDDMGLFDKKSLDKIKKSLEECWEELEI